MQIGIDSFVAVISDPATGLTLSMVERMHDLLEEIELADKVGLDVFGIGECHRAEFLDSAPVVILAAAARRTEKIRLTSAVTVLSASEPVRVFQRFAILDLTPRGGAKIVAGRGSFIESYPLFGLRLEDYDSLFAEKLELHLKIRASTKVHWSGKHRAANTGQTIYSRPLQGQLPIWVGVGGASESFVRAGITVAKKILYLNEVLDGISRVTLQIGVSTLPHEKMLHAVEILGTQLAPIVQSELSVTPERV
jgi:alkanesulfonate monooxygenase SsuD/methylene tetrahydromethanopterin reductase-like flavin-dependent oxidoreductase (luciferase family)